jgi:hypothetical protein
VSRLFVSLYLDEDVDVRVASVIRGRKLTAVTCREAGIIAAVPRPYYDNARRLLALLNQITADEMDNQLLYL